MTPNIGKFTHFYYSFRHAAAISFDNPGALFHDEKYEYGSSSSGEIIKHIDDSSAAVCVQLKKFG